MTRRPKMPRIVRWPFGWKVTIVYKTARQLAQMGLPNTHGCWMGELRTIYVNSDDHVGDQAETIAHECQHAGVDYRHWVDQYVRLPLLHESAATAVELTDDDE